MPVQISIILDGVLLAKAELGVAPGHPAIVLSVAITYPPGDHEVSVLAYPKGSQTPLTASAKAHVDIPSDINVGLESTPPSVGLSLRGQWHYH